MAGAGLEGLAVLHQRLDAIGVVGPGETLALGLLALPQHREVHLGAPLAPDQAHHVAGFSTRLHGVVDDTPDVIVGLL